VLEDLSGQMTPRQWAETVVEAFYGDNHEWGRASSIYAERNQGGKLVENQIQSIDKRVAYDSTHARASKKARAEPIHSLYQNGSVVHCGRHAELESQMINFTHTSGETPDDRLDALVHATTELLLPDDTGNRELKPSHVITRNEI